MITEMVSAGGAGTVNSRHSSAVALFPLAANGRGSLVIVVNVISDILRVLWPQPSEET